MEEAGYSVFFQDWDFKGNFVLEMDKAHTQSRRTLAIFSPDYLTSRFTAPEWAARFAQGATSAHDLLIPVRVRPCELEGLLAQIVYVDLVGCGEAAAKKRLFDRVSGIRAKPDEPPLYPNPSSARHAAVPKRPDYPGVVRTAGRWLHQALIGSGIAAAVVWALLTWWLSATPTQTSVDIQDQEGQIVTGPIAGDAIGQQTTIHGVPFDEYKQIQDELGVTDEALASFFAIVERKRVPRRELEPTLQEIARRYKDLLTMLDNTNSSSPQVQQLKEQARQALDAGELDQAEQLQSLAQIFSGPGWTDLELRALQTAFCIPEAEQGTIGHATLANIKMVVTASELESNSNQYHVDNHIFAQILSETGGSCDISRHRNYYENFNFRDIDAEKFLLNDIATLFSSERNANLPNSFADNGARELIGRARVSCDLPNEAGYLFINQVTPDLFARLTNNVCND